MARIDKLSKAYWVSGHALFSQCHRLRSPKQCQGPDLERRETMRTKMKNGLGAIVLVALTACQSTTTNAPTTTTAPEASTALTSQSAVSATTAFIEACVKTASNPNAAPNVLQSLGFRPTGTQGGDMTFSSPFATAEVSRDTRSAGAYGQCNVTPKSGSFSNSVAELNIAMSQTGMAATKIGGEEGWLLLQTRAVVLVSRSKGTMTRTQPGVFRN